MFLVENLTSLLAVAVLCGVITALGLHLIIYLLRLRANRFLAVLGWIATVLVVMTTSAFLSVAQHGAVETLMLLGLVTLPFGLVALAASLHRRHGVPFCTAFLHLIAEVSCAAILLGFSITLDDTLANALCGSDRSWFQVELARQQAAALTDYFAVALCLALLLLELLYPSAKFMARYRAANR